MERHNEKIVWKMKKREKTQGRPDALTGKATCSGQRNFRWQSHFGGKLASYGPEASQSEEKITEGLTRRHSLGTGSMREWCLLHLSTVQYEQSLDQQQFIVMRAWLGSRFEGDTYMLWH